MSPDISVVGFDLDDTLYDHRQYVTAGFEAVADEIQKRESIDVYDDLITTYYDDEKYNQTFDVVLEDHRLSKELVPILVTKYHKKVGDITPLPSVKPVLDTLSTSYQTALITDGKNTSEKLRRLSLNTSFDYVLATNSHPFSKSDQEPFQRLLDRFEIEPMEAVYVGNDPRVDFAHPNSFGMHTVWLRRGLYADTIPKKDSIPDIEINDLNQLPDIVTDLNQ